MSRKDPPRMWLYKIRFFLRHRRTLGFNKKQKQILRDKGIKV